MSTPRKQDGFSLTEMLIALGIMSLLAAILYPTFISLRKQNRSVGCLRNLRQIGVLMQNYVADHQVYPAAALQTYTSSGAAGAIRFWAQELVAHAGLKDVRCLICPAVSRKDLRPALAQNRTNDGYAFAYVSYAMNRYGIGPGVTDSHLPPRASAITDPAHLLLAMDYDSRSQPFDGWYYTSRGEAERAWSFISQRHDGRVNALFCDGHVETLTYDTLFEAPANESPWAERKYTRKK